MLSIVASVLTEDGVELPRAKHFATIVVIIRARLVVRELAMVALHKRYRQLSLCLSSVGAREAAASPCAHGSTTGEPACRPLRTLPIFEARSCPPRRHNCAAASAHKRDGMDKNFKRTSLNLS